MCFLNLIVDFLFVDIHTAVNFFDKTSVMVRLVFMLIRHYVITIRDWSINESQTWNSQPKGTGSG